jgi:ATPase subunit of ABC transporter with duplicated ATPase domains
MPASAGLTARQPALDAYQGALLLASHDLPFLRSVTITRWLRLDRDSGLAAIEPPGR